MRISDWSSDVCSSDLGVKNRIQLVALRTTNTSDSSAIGHASKGIRESLGDDPVLEVRFVKGERGRVTQAILDLPLEEHQLFIEVFIKGFYEIGHRCHDHSECKPESALADGDHMVCGNMPIAGPNIGSTKRLSNRVE